MVQPARSCRQHAFRKKPYNISTLGRTPAERVAIIDYAKRVNLWLAQNGPAIVKAKAGKMRRQATKAARAERLRAKKAGQPYTGQAGHVPDTAGPARTFGGTA